MPTPSAPPPLPVMVPTPLGTIAVYATTATHVAIHARKETPLVVNGVEYQVSAHFSVEDGRWRLEDLYARRVSLRPSASRRSGAIASDYPTDKARERLTATLTSVVTTWAQANPRALLEAQRFYLHERCRRLESDLEELAAKTAALHAQLATVEHELAAVTASLLADASQ